uniref:Uncharacterized protein n=1 Tax=Trichogramma kaykai TaxID=54128 RepID=A0ABD2X127_9HYME
MSDGQREQQAPKSARDDGAMSRSKSGSQLPLPTNIRSSPSMIAAAITRKILGAPLVTTKDAPHHRTYASGSCEEKWTRIEGLIKIKTDLSSLIIVVIATVSSRQQQMDLRDPSNSQSYGQHSIEFTIDRTQS